MQVFIKWENFWIFLFHCSKFRSFVYARRLVDLLTSDAKFWLCEVVLLLTLRSLVKLLLVGIARHHVRSAIFCFECCLIWVESLRFWIFDFGLGSALVRSKILVCLSRKLYGSRPNNYVLFTWVCGVFVIFSGVRTANLIAQEPVVILTKSCCDRWLPLGSHICQRDWPRSHWLLLIPDLISLGFRVYTPLLVALNLI